MKAEKHTHVCCADFVTAPLVKQEMKIFPIFPVIHTLNVRARHNIPNQFNIKRESNEEDWMR